MDQNKSTTTPSAYCNKCDIQYQQVKNNCTGKDASNGSTRDIIMTCSKIGGEYCIDKINTFKANPTQFDCTLCTGYYIAKMESTTMTKDQKECADIYYSQTGDLTTSTTSTTDTTDTTNTTNTTGTSNQAQSTSSSYAVIILSASVLHWF